MCEGTLQRKHFWKSRAQSMQATWWPHGLKWQLAAFWHMRHSDIMASRLAGASFGDPSLGGECVGGTVEGVEGGFTFW